MPDTRNLEDLWTRIENFCLIRGWDAELFVRESGDQFGRVGARVVQATESFQAFGNTTNEAIGNLVPSLERYGFDARSA